ncbi:MAG: putative DNA binding domain-containing protein [Phycisphaeraceae bacterium]|nr:putative DNA binding domain-containing protein [Phycisphaeraceae bacterium]
MTLAQLHELVSSGESECLEFKRSTGERRQAIQSLCAMLNHRGGRVLIGVDSAGMPLGQEVTDKTLEDVAQEIKEIDPPVFPALERVPVGNGREVVAVTISHGQNRPYSVRGVAYRRVGNTTQAMSRDEYNRMLIERLHGEIRWENQVADGWQVAHLDGTAIRRTLEESIRRGRAEDPNTRDLQEVLRGFGLVRGGSLLRGAVVLFGDSGRLEAEFPQCTLRVARFRGRDKTEFIDNRQFHGNALSLLVLAERFLRESLPLAGRIVPGLFERVDDPLYPPVALREALANAFCHRDYSIGGGSVAIAVFDDRLEITSSGTLHFGLTPADLLKPHESLPWNPLIARVFFRCGLIESWGRGTIKMIEQSQRAGLSAPVIEEHGGCVTVRFFASRYVPPQRIGHALTDRQQQMLVLIAQHGQLPLRLIGSLLATPTPQWAIKNDLSLLKSLGLVETKGHGRGAVWTVVG